MTLSPRSPPRSDPAAEAGELIARLGIFVLAVGVPLAGVFSHRVIYTLTLIGAILILISAPLRPRRTAVGDLFSPFLSKSGMALIFIAVWSAVSLGWTPLPGNGAARLWGFAGTVAIAALAGALSPKRTRTKNLYLFPIGVGVAGLAAIVLAFLHHDTLARQGSGIYDSTLARASLCILMFAWPALAALAVRERWRSAVAVACAVAGAVLVIGSPTVVAGLFLGLFVYASALVRPRLVSRTLATLIALALLAAPVAVAVAGALATRVFPQAAFADQIETLSRFVDAQGVRLVTGHGVGSIGAIAAAGALPNVFLRSEVFQVWYELGLLGALAEACLAVATLSWAARIQQPMTAFLMAALAVGAFLSMAELPTSQIWWVTLAAIAALGFLYAKRGRYRTQRPRAPLISDVERPKAPVV